MGIVSAELVLPNETRLRFTFTANTANTGGLLIAGLIFGVGHGHRGGFEREINKEMHQAGRINSGLC